MFNIYVFCNVVNHTSVYKPYMCTITMLYNQMFHTGIQTSMRIISLKLFECMLKMKVYNRTAIRKSVFRPNATTTCLVKLNVLNVKKNQSVRTMLIWNVWSLINWCVHFELQKQRCTHNMIIACRTNPMHIT